MYRPLRSLLSTTCLSAAAVFMAAGVAVANPVDGTVVGGSAVIAASGNTLNVTQSSDRAVIDWRGFDIGAGETTAFHQPSSGSVAINRVTMGGASRIDGNLTANGNVVIINQNGVLFGAGSQVDVNGLVASTADISTASAMAGGPLVFGAPGNASATISNAGTITAKDAGLVGFVAPNVVNSGVITARLGRVHLASGDTATVDLYGDGLMSVAVSDAVTSQLVSNTGTIAADGGTIALTAAAGSSIVNSLITHSGTLRAQTIGSAEGEITIAAEGSNAVVGNAAADKGKKSGTSTVLVSGVLDVSGRKKGERGGKVIVTGDNVALLDGTLIDATGDTGASGTTEGLAKSAVREGSAGGDIRIGGDYLGGGVTPTALNLYVDPGVLVVNDALTEGDAGRTIFWSDDSTQFYGNVYARALGGLPVDPLTWHATPDLALPPEQRRRGDGGFVETSGHRYLDARGYVNLTASNGNRGTYFLDPTNITIYGNAASIFDSTSLVAGYTFDEGTGTSAADFSGNSNTGTLANGPTWSSTVAPTPQANSHSLSFNGGTSVVNLTNNSGLSTLPSGDWSASFWANITSYTTFGGIIFFNNDGVVQTYSQKFGLVHNGNNVENSQSFSLNTWSHIVAVKSGSTYTLYVDGNVSHTAYYSDNNYGRANTYSLGAAYSGYTGLLDDVRIYNNAISANDVSELYGTRFTVAGLQEMSATADISLAASNNITLDFQGDTLTTAVGRNFTLSAGNQITTASTGTITTNGGNINLTGTSGIVFGNAFALNSGSGNITLNSPTTLNAALTANAGSGTLTFGSTVNGANNLTGTAATFGLTSALGGTTPLAAVSLTSTNGITLPSISAASILVRTTGATSDVTVASGKTLTAYGSGNAITLASGRNFINSATTPFALSGGGRWLVYSTNPASNTLNSLTGDFNRYSCSYSTAGACTGGTITMPGAGNGFLYSYTPTLTITPSALSALTYGDAAPSLVGYSYGVTGYFAGEGTDTVSGSLTGTTDYDQGDNVGSYYVHYGSGTLTSALGYGFTYANNATAITVGQRTLTAGLTGTVSKGYDGTNTATLASGNYTLSTIYSSDDVSIATTAGTYDTATVGTSKTVSVTGLTLTGAKAGNYTLASSSTSGAVGSVTQRAITLTAGNQSQTYGDSHTLTGGYSVTSGSLVSGEAITGGVSLSTNATDSTSGNWNYNATPWTITATGTPTGTGGFTSGNYAVTFATGSLTIARKTLTVSATGVNKGYDGTTTGTVTLGDDRITNDVFTSRTYTAATFADANVANGIAVHVTGIAISGGDAGNYSLAATTADTTANITQRAITITAGNQSQTYGDSHTLTGGYSVTSGSLVSGEAITGGVSLSTNATDSTSGNWNYNATPWTITATGTPTGTGGFAAGNYAVTFATGSLTIARKTLTVSATGVNKGYDGTTTGTVTLGDDRITNDVFTSRTYTAATFADPNVANGIAVHVTGIAISGGDAGNYSLAATTADTTANITQRAITVTAGNQSQTYGVSHTLTGGYSVTSGSLASGEAITGGVSLSTNATDSTSGNWNYNATPWTITATGTPTGTGGFTSGNYAVTFATGSLTIARKTLTVSATGTDRGYDGTTTTTVTLGDDRITNDLFSDSYGVASFADADAAAGKTVTVTGIAISGADAGNYSLAATTASTSATIAKQALTVTAGSQTITADLAVPASSSLSYSGFISGEDASFLTSAPTVTSARSGLVAAGTYAGNYTAAGCIATNYSFAYLPGDLIVTAAAVSPGATMDTLPNTVLRSPQDIPTDFTRYNGWWSGIVLDGFTWLQPTIGGSMLTPSGQTSAPRSTVTRWYLPSTPTNLTNGAQPNSIPLTIDPKLAKQIQL